MEEKIRLNGDTLALLSELEKLARAQNEVGKVTLQDVLRAQYDLHPEGIAKRVREFVGPRRFGTIGEFVAMVDEITRDIPDEEMRKLPSSDRIDEVVYGIKPRAAVK